MEPGVPGEAGAHRDSKSKSMLRAKGESAKGTGGAGWAPEGRGDGGDGGASGVETSAAGSTATTAAFEGRPPTLDGRAALEGGVGWRLLILRMERHASRARFEVHASEYSLNTRTAARMSPASASGAQLRKVAV